MAERQAGKARFQKAVDPHAVFIGGDGDCLHAGGVDGRGHRSCGGLRCRHHRQSFARTRGLVGLAACDRFIKLYPNHPNLDYVFYLKGLINFNEDLGLLGKVSKQDPTERDNRGAKESFDTFKAMFGMPPSNLGAINLTWTAIDVRTSSP